MCIWWRWATARQMERTISAAPAVKNINRHTVYAQTQKTRDICRAPAGALQISYTYLMIMLRLLLHNNVAVSNCWCKVLNFFGAYMRYNYCQALAHRIMDNSALTWWLLYSGHTQVTCNKRVCTCTCIFIKAVTLQSGWYMYMYM